MIEMSIMIVFLVINLMVLARMKMKAFLESLIDALIGMARRQVVIQEWQFRADRKIRERIILEI